MTYLYLFFFCTCNYVNTILDIQYLKLNLTQCLKLHMTEVQTHITEVQSFQLYMDEVQSYFSNFN